MDFWFCFSSSHSLPFHALILSLLQSALLPPPAPHFSHLEIVWGFDAPSPHLLRENKLRSSASTFSLMVDIMMEPVGQLLLYSGWKRERQRLKVSTGVCRYPIWEGCTELGSLWGTLWRVTENYREFPASWKQLAVRYTPINLNTEHIRSSGLLPMARFSSVAFLLLAILLLSNGLDVSLI